MLWKNARSSSLVTLGFFFAVMIVQLIQVCGSSSAAGNPNAHLPLWPHGRPLCPDCLSILRHVDV